MNRSWIVIAAAVILAVPAAWGQKRPRGENTASRDDYSVSHAGRAKAPRNFEKYYYGRNRTYVVSPYIFNPAQPITLGPVTPYTDEEYGRLVLSLMDKGIEPASARRTSSILDRLKTASGESAETIEVEAVDVIDRGVLIVDTREELRLRGIRIPSERLGSETERYYARQAAKKLRELTQDQQLHVAIEEPVRDKDGTLLGRVYLVDGTDLSRLLLEQGLGTVYHDDFPDDEAPAVLVEAEQMAQKNKEGLWSGKK